MPAAQLARSDSGHGSARGEKAGASFLALILARLKSALRLPPAPSLQIVALVRGSHALTALMIAAFHQNWRLTFTASQAEALALLQHSACVALVYDADFRAGDWREVCHACMELDVPFFLASGQPSDDLFLAVVGAGGSGVLWKPFDAGQLIDAIGDSTRSPAMPESLLSAPGKRDILF